MKEYERGRDSNKIVDVLPDVFSSEQVSMLKTARRIRSPLELKCVEADTAPSGLGGAIALEPQCDVVPVASVNICFNN